MKTPVITELPIDQIETLAQVREHFDQEKLDGLAANITEADLLKPVLVQQLPNGKYRLIDGERRLRACRSLGKRSIFAVIREESLSELDFLLKQLSANIHSEELKPMEKATALAKLMKLGGWSVSQAAAKLGISAPSATKLMALLTLPSDIQTKIDTGKVPASSGYELSQVADPAQQAELAAKLEAGEITRDGVAGARKAARQAAKGDAGVMTRATAVLGAGRTITVSANELTLEGVIGMLQDCLAEARKAKQAGVQLATFISMLRDRSQSA